MRLFCERVGMLKGLFFHEYGRRVGMVPRSSLKEGKYSQMVGEKDKDNPTKTKQPKPTTAQRPSLHPVVFPLYWGETSETLTGDYLWA